VTQTARPQLEFAEIFLVSKHVGLETHHPDIFCGKNSDKLGRPGVH
jgi:hypothetical protein